jgi:hypothetical protein
MTAISGDASGPLSGAVVQGLQGRSISATKPTDRQALVWSAAVSQWQPSSVTSTLTGDASGPAGATVVNALQGRAVAATAPTDGQALEWNAAASQWQPANSTNTLGGDASGPAGAAVVKALQGRPISVAIPSNGQALRWNGATSQWEPGQAPVNYSAAFTAQTSVTIPASAHGFNTTNLIVQCYDTGSSVILPYSIAINNATYDITIGFSTPQSGRCVVNGTASAATSGGGGSSPVTSIFGRDGIVSAQAGDYSFSQIGGVIANQQLPSGIDAAKIGAGTVSSNVFGCLANVGSDIQAQIDGKAGTTHSHTVKRGCKRDVGHNSSRGNPGAAGRRGRGQRWAGADMGGCEGGDRSNKTRVEAAH